MANVPITSLPVAVALGPTTDYLEVSRYVGFPGATYQSYRCTPQQIANTFINNVPSGVEYVIYNAGYALTAGTQPFIQMPYTATIVGASLVAAPTGSITVDIWRTPYAQFDGGVTHPVLADTICDTNPLSISNGLKAISTLAGWSTNLNSTDVLAINLSGLVNVTQATVTLYLKRVLS